MPKIIAIAGGGRNVGKTTLAGALAEILPGEVTIVKLGHHPPNKERARMYYPMGTALEDILSSCQDCDYLIVESGAVLEKNSCDLGIFLPAAGGEDKPGSHRRLARAHIVRGGKISLQKIAQLAKRLSVTEKTAHEIIDRVNLIG